MLHKNDTLPSCLATPFITSPSFSLLAPPTHQPFPWVIVAETKRKDGWCCFELWHVSMQVNPLLFINNWPGPSVPAIYRADCCFAREHKRWELYFSTFPDSENHMNSFLNSASDKPLDLRRLHAQIVAWGIRRKPSSLSRSLSESSKPAFKSIQVSIGGGRTY